MSPVQFCDDAELGYDRSRTRLVASQALALDESYRLAHLPLIAPDHPDVIPARDGAFYDRGRHPKVFSLALPVPWRDLAASPAFGELERELRAAPFAPKIAWDLMDRRQDRLHATVCGSLAVGDDAVPRITPAQRRDLSGLGPLHMELRGLFSGNVNVGRRICACIPSAGTARMCCGRSNARWAGGRRICTSSGSTISSTI